MILVRRLLSRTRVRRAMQRLAQDPSPGNYCLLAQEHVISGALREALRVCEEGIVSFPRSAELARLAERLRQRQRETRMRDLKQVLREAPRPAVWREMCEILLESSQVSRAEDICLDWMETTQEPESRLMLARIRLERFFEERNREAGRRAQEALLGARAALPRDARPLELMVSLSSRIGAWGEARKALAALLELAPGNPALEGRFRTLESRKAGAPDFTTALRDVERTGVLIEEDPEPEHKEVATRDVRPLLQRLAATPGVEAALYVRGGTALVQGPKGATAERSARSVRQVVLTGRGVARRLGLGALAEVSVDAESGATLTVAAGELDAGALLCEGVPTRSQLQALIDLAGVDASLQGSAA